MIYFKNKDLKPGSKVWIGSVQVEIKCTPAAVWRAEIIKGNEKVILYRTSRRKLVRKIRKFIQHPYKIRNTVNNENQWAKCILFDFNLKCYNCGTYEYLTAHHIWDKVTYPKLKLELNNGICLCDKCHKSFHNAYGYRNNDPYQLKEFLLKDDPFKDIEVFEARIEMVTV